MREEREREREKERRRGEREIERGGGRGTEREGDRKVTMMLFIPNQITNSRNPRRTNFRQPFDGSQEGQLSALD